MLKYDRIDISRGVIEMHLKSVVFAIVGNF